MAAQSTPFISASERTTFRACRFRWYLAYMMRVKPIRAAPPLRFGTLLHRSLETYYQVGTIRGPHPAETFERVYDAELKEQVAMGFRDEDGAWSDAKSLGIDMLEHYRDHFGNDDEYEVLSSEQRFEQPIVTPRGNLVGICVGVIDLVMRHRPTRLLEIWDHKGWKSIDTGQLTLDTQKSTYWTWGVDYLKRKGILKDTEKLRTVKFNILRKGKRDLREWIHGDKGQKLYTNLDGSVSKQQPSPHFVRHPVPMTEAERELERMMMIGELRDIALTRAGKLDIYKNPSKFTCMFCDFRDVCELHQVGGDWEEMLRLTTVAKGTWTPIEYTQEAVEFQFEH